jgi:hypothetical protein
MSRHDVHNYQRKVQTILDSIHDNDAISKANKDDIDDFYGFLQGRSMSNARMHRYLGCIKKIAAYEENDFRLKSMTEKQVLQILSQIRQ